MTIYTGVENASFSTQIQVFTSQEQVFANLKLKDQDGNVIADSAGLPVLTLTVAQLLEAGGVTLDDVNPQDWAVNNPSYSPTYRFTGIRLIGRLKYTNLEPWALSGEIQGELTIVPMVGQWKYATKEPMWITDKKGIIFGSIGMMLEYRIEGEI